MDVSLYPIALPISDKTTRLSPGSVHISSIMQSVLPIWISHSLYITVRYFSVQDKSGHVALHINRMSAELFTDPVSIYN